MIARQDQQNQTIAKEQKNLVELVRVLFPQLREISDIEIMKALALAKRLGLDPLKKEVHLVPYGGRVQLVISYLEYVRRAVRSGKLNGWEIRLGKDEFGEFAEVEIHRRDWEHSFKWRVYLHEVRKDTPNWRTMPLFMLRKTAIAQAFRMCFPEETQELPEEGEIAEYETVEVEEVRKISEIEAKRLWRIAKELGEEVGVKKVEVERVVRETLNDYGIESTKEIPIALYDEVIENIKARILELAKREEEEKES